MSGAQKFIFSIFMQLKECKDSGRIGIPGKELAIGQ